MFLCTGEKKNTRDDTTKHNFLQRNLLFIWEFLASNCVKKTQIHKNNHLLEKKLAREIHKMFFNGKKKQACKFYEKKNSQSFWLMMCLLLEERLMLVQKL